MFRIKFKINRTSLSLGYKVDYSMLNEIQGLTCQLVKDSADINVKKLQGKTSDLIAKEKDIGVKFKKFLKQLQKDLDDIGEFTSNHLRKEAGLLHEQVETEMNSVSIGKNFLNFHSTKLQVELSDLIKVVAEFWDKSRFFMATNTGVKVSENLDNFLKINKLGEKFQKQYRQDLLALWGNIKHQDEIKLTAFTYNLENKHLEFPHLNTRKFNDEKIDIFVETLIKNTQLLLKEIALTQGAKRKY